MSDFETYWMIPDLLVTAGVISLPLVVVCGLIERVYNALYGMVTGRQVVKF